MFGATLRSWQNPEAFSQASCGYHQLCSGHSRRGAGCPPGAGAALWLRGAERPGRALGLGWERGWRGHAAYECLLLPAASVSHQTFTTAQFFCCFKIQSKVQSTLGRFAQQQGRPGVLPDTKLTLRWEGGRKLQEGSMLYSWHLIHFCWINFSCLYSCHAPPTQVCCAFPLRCHTEQWLPGALRGPPPQQSFTPGCVCPARLCSQLVFVTTLQKQQRIEKVLFGGKKKREKKQREKSIDKVGAGVQAGTCLRYRGVICFLSIFKIFCFAGC